MHTIDMQINNDNRKGHFKLYFVGESEFLKQCSLCFFLVVSHSEEQPMPGLV